MLVSKEKKKARKKNTAKRHSAPAESSRPSEAKSVNAKTRKSYLYWKAQFKRNKLYKLGGKLTWLGSIGTIIGASSKACGAYVMNSPALLAVGIITMAVGLYYIVKSLI